jgi:predicted nicotinamide N-methyase
VTLQQRDHRTAGFVRANTRLRPAPYVPEVRLHLADEPYGVWERTEAVLGGGVAPVPFWAFVWAGGQALARQVLDRPGTVAGRTVLDLGAGSGLVAIASALAGAAAAAASDVDPYAAAAIALNAEANGVPVELRGDVLGGPADADVVLAGDVFYDRDMAAQVLPFLHRARTAGALVLVGDPGRAYRPASGLRQVDVYEVPVDRSLEDVETRRTTVWELCSPLSAAEAPVAESG